MFRALLIFGFAFVFQRGVHADSAPDPSVTLSDVAVDTLPQAPPDVLTLADLEGIAFENHPTLAAAIARINAARGRRLQSTLYPNPVIGYHSVEMGLRGTAGQQGAFISQRFITAGKLRLDEAIARQEVNVAHFQFHAQEQRVLSDVRMRFYETLVAQRRIELSDELARIGEKVVSATERLIEGRHSTENDLLQAEIRADEAYILRDNARNQYVEAWRRLAAVIGLPHMERTSLSGELDANFASYEWDDCYATVLSGNPALRAARARANRARITVQRESVEPIPNVDVTVSHRHHQVTEDRVTNVQLGVRLPLFDKNQGSIRSARADWIAACHEVKRIELELQDRLAVAYRRYANARHQKDRYRRRIIPRADKSLQLVSDGYRQGQVEYLTLLTAQQTYIQVNLSYLEALREQWIATSAIESQLLTGSLAALR